MRRESDFLGPREINDSCYYGIHTHRATENFCITSRPIHPKLVEGIVLVKKAAAITNTFIGLLDKSVADAIVTACDEVLKGNFKDQFVVDCLQGGAGTSSNMNVNEVLANRAIEILGGNKGSYSIVHPLDHVNLSQSTNDVVPTAVRIALIQMLDNVESLFAKLQTTLLEKALEFSGIIKVGRTQLQDAVPIYLGQEFEAWSCAITRDHIRLNEIRKKLKMVNIGGTAVGTGINADPRYISQIIGTLNKVTGLKLTRSEFMMDITQNNDVIVELSGILKTAAVNLLKISNDLRLLSSGPRTGLGEVFLPPVQAGSSIMPGKVNPVIPEAINQVAFQIIGNDLTVTLAAQAGQLELNAFLPVISHNVFEMFDILENGLQIFILKCLQGIAANTDQCEKYVNESLVLVTGLVNYIGYEEAAKIAKKCIKLQKNIRDVLLEDNVFDEDEIDSILNPLHQVKSGWPGRNKIIS